MLILDKFIACIFIVVLALVSCNSNRDTFDEDYAKLYQKKNFYKYKSIYDIAGDTVKEWIRDSLKNSYVFYLNEYQIDSAMIFNQDSTRLFSTINFRDTTFKDSKADAAHELLGAKINSKWYFMLGAGLYISRENYQDKIYEPMTFDEISYIAHINFIQNFLIKKQNGDYESDNNKINAYILDPHTYGCRAGSTKADNDMCFLEEYKSYRIQKLDQERWQKSLLYAKNSKKPPEPNRSLWDKWFGPKKIFEMKDWRTKVSNNQLGKSK